VTPDLGAKKSDRVVITPNQPPVANAGSDQTVVQGSVVTLDGRTSTDPNNAIVDYRWRQLSGPAVTLQASANPGVVSFTAQRLRGLQSADLVFELVVTDATGDSATDQVVVHVVK
jgi:chitinase